MTPEERQLQFKTQTTALYAGLGEFVVSFEHMVHSMRQSIVFLMGIVPAPNHFLQQEFASIMTADLTIDPLLKVFRSTFLARLNSYAHQNEVGLVTRMLTNICNRIDTIKATRNQFVHGTWFINYASVEQEDFSVAHGEKPKNTAKGLQHDELRHTVESFQKCIAEVKILDKILTELTMCMIGGRSLEENFKFDDHSGHVVRR